VGKNLQNQARETTKTAKKQFLGHNLKNNGDKQAVPLQDG